LASLIDPEKVIIGGKSDPKLRYIDPTILFPVSWDDPIMEDEIFGPLLPVMKYEDFDAAISEVKKRPKPLSAFLFSREQRAIDDFLGSLSFGGGAINQVNIHLFVETMPFGGDRELGNRKLFRQVWIRFADARQIDPDLSSGCCDRSSLSAVHASEGPGAPSMV
jgi:acyl-CoA reductase-like NAD-dependent aldehyde dehydrogenase